MVLGATSIIGRGLVRAATEAGRPVVAVDRDPLELEQLRVECKGADLALLASRITADADGARLASRLRAQDRPYAGVIDAMIAGDGRGRLLDHPSDELRRALDHDLLPHLAAARHLISLLAESRRRGNYVLIGGAGSESPWSNYGFRSVTAAGLRMLARVLHDEARSLDVRVQLLSIDAPVRAETPCAHQCPEWPSGLDVGRLAMRLMSRDQPAGYARPIVHLARSAARDDGSVDSTPAATTTQGPGTAEARSFLESLNFYVRNEVDPHDNP